MRVGDAAAAGSIPAEATVPPSLTHSDGALFVSGVLPQFASSLTVKATLAISLAVWARQFAQAIAWNRALLLLLLPLLLFLLLLLLLLLGARKMTSALAAGG